MEAVELRGLRPGTADRRGARAIAEAQAIVIGPSSPVISIGPILALPGMREALRAAPAPVVAVSPFVGGRSLKGPTEAFCKVRGDRARRERDRARVRGAIDGLVADEEAEGRAHAS